MKRFERSNGLDTALYKNYLYLFYLYKSPCFDAATPQYKCVGRSCITAVDQFQLVAISRYINFVPVADVFLLD